jgi:uncharacterized protein (TIGR00251 family)
VEPAGVTNKLNEKDGALRFEVHAKPRAKKSRIVGPRGDALEVALAAPPVDGAANEELVRVLADALGVPRRSVTIVRGETSQKKLVAVDAAGLDQATLLARLAGPS